MINMINRTGLAIILLLAAGCDRRPPATAKAPSAPAPASAPVPASPPAATTPPASEAPAALVPAPIAPAIPAAPKPEFKPSVHGFAFVNAFRGSPLPASLRQFERALGGSIPDRFGLCGGMCSAVADYYLSSEPIPTENAAPVEGDDLYTYLYDRQVDSLGGINLPIRVLQSMAALDSGPEGLQAGTAREIPSIRKRLAEGELVQLCIILVKAGKGAPWDNHQVLAYADATTDERSPIIRIYDPNYPGDDRATLNLSATDDGFACTRTAHRPVTGPPRVTTVRGLFATPYSKRNPTGTTHSTTDSPSEKK